MEQHRQAGSVHTGKRNSSCILTKQLLLERFLEKKERLNAWPEHLIGHGQKGRITFLQLHHMFSVTLHVVLPFFFFVCHTKKKANLYKI